MSDFHFFTLKIRKQKRNPVVFSYEEDELVVTKSHETFFMLNLTELLKFQRLIKTKMLKMKTFLPSKLSDAVFIMLINIKITTYFDILTFMSMKSVMIK